MKIRLRADTAHIDLVLPTRLLFSRSFWKLGLRIGRKYSVNVPDLPPAAVDALCREIRRIKDRHGAWELVHICDGDGNSIQVIM
ncbi:MAG: hypothetical protein E7436_04825 [Ruminococcaceae bacterium]|nr:hypothetical protein [Oscillospiraceae bacterium]